MRISDWSSDVCSSDLSVWLAVKCGIAGRLRGATWLQVYGVAILCGIGFTMSLFIGGLAFPGAPLLVEEAKIGILMGSLVAALAGLAVLRLAPLPPQHEAAERDVDGETRSEERSEGKAGVRACSSRGSRNH